tara:strand:+ start:34 stop:456 length:423 start_codon:yes stop_codon:yes gene_type:complete
VKKKISATSKDKMEWEEFTKEMGSIRPKEDRLSQKKIKLYKVRKLDLHGNSLIEGNKKVKKFIIESSDLGCKKILVVTGKGTRSKTYDNPYVSDKLSKLRYSIPEFIKNDEILNEKVQKVVEADKKDGGEGAIYILLKNN